MTAPDFKRLLLLAQLSSVIYKTGLNELSAMVAGLGFNFVEVFEAPGFQAIVATENDGGQIIAFRGTPVTCGRDIEDTIVALGYDMGLDHTDLGGRATVLTGVYEAVRENWPHIWAKIDPSKPVTITGHSLGGAKSLAAADFVPLGVDLSVVAFAPFQIGNAGFWLRVFGQRELPLIVGRGADFALGWNHCDPVTRHPGTILHLVDGKTEWLPHWPWCDESVSDHDVDGYAADLQALAAQLVEA